MRALRRRLTAITTVVLLVAACGGGGGISTEDFIDELEDICRDIERDLDRLDEPDSYETLAALAGDARDIIEDGLDAMNELEVPEDLQRDVDDFLELVEENSDVIRDLGRAAADQDDAAITEANDRLAVVRDDRNEVAEDLGADRCITEDDESEEPAPDTTPATTQTTAAPTTEAPVTAPPVTAPPISQVPITSPTTVAVDPEGIGTIDITTAFAPPAGFVLQDAGADTLSTIKDAFAQTPAVASSVRSVGAALVVDETETVAAVMFLTFWNGDVSGTPVQTAFENELTATAASFTNEVTPDGLEHVLYTDPDGTVGLVATSNDVSLWLIVEPGREEFAQLLVDDFLEANAG
jgi:hypothetical protein